MIKAFAVAGALCVSSFAAPTFATVPITLSLENTNRVDGFVVLSDETSFTITGGNNEQAGFTFMRGVANSDFSLSGVWFYETLDSDGPLYDPGGYFINGDFFQLSDNDGAVTQNGMFSLMLATGDSFGFFVETTDGLFGRGSLSISELSQPYAFGGNISGVVPEPASWALMIAGFGLVGATMRRRRMATTIA